MSLERKSGKNSVNYMAQSFLRNHPYAVDYFRIRCVTLSGFKFSLPFYRGDPIGFLPAGPRQSLPGLLLSFHRYRFYRDLAGLQQDHPFGASFLPDRTHFHALVHAIFLAVLFQLPFRQAGNQSIFLSLLTGPALYRRLLAVLFVLYGL